MRKNVVVILATCWMLVLVILATVFFTSQYMAGHPLSMLPIGGMSAAADGESDREIAERYKRLEEVRKILHERYYTTLADEQLVLGAVRGMLAAPDDPYTYYYTPEENAQNSELMSGYYEGIGLVIGADEEKLMTILRVFPDTPAHEAGILPGDRLMKINGTDVSARTHQTMDDAIALIKTSENPTVMLTLLRSGSLVDLEVTRAMVNATRTAHRMIDDKIGYIAIHEFMGDAVPGFERAISELQTSGMQALIIDVRNNPGGILYDVVTIADALLPEGLIVYTEDREGRRDEYASDANALSMPIAVLVNDMSASASEILAGSLQDYGVATIVGETTFGKGLVQEAIPFREDGAGLKLTISTYFTPEGRSIHGVGIVPDVHVSLPEDVNQAMAELMPERDEQLQTAIQLLNDQLDKPE